jgi:hypothetical protein
MGRENYWSREIKQQDRRRKASILTKPEPTLVFKLEFYRGVKDIATFLKMHPDTVRDLIKAGKIPAKMDETGRWTLNNWDYFISLQG